MSLHLFQDDDNDDDDDDDYDDYDDDANYCTDNDYVEILAIWDKN